MTRFARRHTRLLALVAASLVAAAVVAGTSLATSATSSGPSGSVLTATTSTTVPGTVAGAALQQTFVNVVRAVSPSVVQIEDRTGLGSGIVLDSGGDIVTNNHVVTGATAFTVTTSTGKRYPARLVGAFPPDDLAVIRVSGASQKPATFADSSALQVGDLAIAIGNPLGLQSSVTEGIVSAFRQATQEPGNVTLPSVIQTSAAINPGNSGGALVDIEGHVIGIPTLAATDPEIGGSAPGIGFAIPSNLVKNIAGQIVAHGKVVDSHRAYLGVEVGPAANGVYVGRVTAGGPAATAGIRAGDVIVSVAGTPTPNPAELTTELAGLEPGKTISVAVRGQRGATRTVQLTLGTYPGS